MTRPIIPPIPTPQISEKEVTKCQECHHVRLRLGSHHSCYRTEYYYYWACIAPDKPYYRELSKEFGTFESAKRIDAIPIPDWCPFRVKEEEKL